MSDEPRFSDSFLISIREAGSVLLTTHRSPDGDAVGSSLAAAHMLEALGKNVVVWIPSGVPGPYAFLPGTDGVHVGEPPPGPFDVTLVVDTSEPGLLEGDLPGPDVCGKVLVLDHHLSGGTLGDEVVRVEVAATGELVWELAGLLGLAPSGDFAICVYVAILTDTGMFRYDLTSPESHRIAARCLELGVRPYEVARHVYESYPAAYLSVWAELLGTVHLDLDGTFATLVVPPDLLSRHGVSEEALEEVVGYPRGIEGVEVAALIRRKADGRVRVSLRSTGRVNVAELASHFGGGGHFGAAGCDFPPGTDLSEARRRLASVLGEKLGR
ncbi:MAG: DHH family phosphoesterase [Deltaproteobacteria bacterium]|nr:DHH family phosphoesterase [Deltaproteobacteria bacterium]